MSKQKLYVIRKIGFDYGDDWYYNVGMVGYYGSYSDLVAAQNALEKAENEIYRQYYIIQFLIGDDKDTDDLKRRLNELEKYVQKHFEISLKTGERAWDYNENFKIPESATDNQVEEIRDIIKISFHKIVELEKESEKEIRYAISNFGRDSHLDQGEYGKPIFFQTFDTESEAYAAVIQEFEFSKDREIAGFGGNMARLTELPDLLKSYIDSCSSWELFAYQSDYWMIVKNGSGPKHIEEFKGIIPLLKNPCLKVIQI